MARKYATCCLNISLSVCNHHKTWVGKNQMCIPNNFTPNCRLKAKQNPCHKKAIVCAYISFHCLTRSCNKFWKFIVRTEIRAWLGCVFEIITHTGTNTGYVYCWKEGHGIFEKRSTGFTFVRIICAVNKFPFPFNFCTFLTTGYLWQWLLFIIFSFCLIARNRD